MDIDIKITLEDINVVMGEDENVLLKLKIQALKRMLADTEKQDTLTEDQDVVSPSVPAKPTNGRVASSRRGSSKSTDTPA